MPNSQAPIACTTEEELKLTERLSIIYGGEILFLIVALKEQFWSLKSGQPDLRAATLGVILEKLQTQHSF